MPNNWQSPFAELAYFIRNLFLRLTTNTFMSGIPNHSLHSLITSTDTVDVIVVVVVVGSSREYRLVPVFQFSVGCNLRRQCPGVFSHGLVVISATRCFPCCRNVWKFLQKVAKDAYNLTDYISRHLETAAQLLKKCPDKWSVIFGRRWQ